MPIETDAKNQPYFNVSNIRITFVPSSTRDPDKLWENTDMIRFNAYKGDGTNALHRGAEIPIDSPARLIEIIEAICAVYAEGQRRYR